ncbi:immunoglobulin superfamily member 1-like [Ascaphus truei]|uniref:immunoglobulin superfamily member 1-like n=1 Tax=Ascaphus truei TaxID=8439 RepID=UPI003F5A4103
MISFLSFTVSFTCYLLVLEQASGGQISKPTLTVNSSVIMIGDTILVSCNLKDGSGAHNFSLSNTNTDTVRTEKKAEFTFTNIMESESGLYTCSYCVQSGCSDPSNHVEIYVRDTFQQPTITVIPRKIVQPGASITIKCEARYANMAFTLYKDRAIVKQETTDGKVFTYHIKNAAESDRGQYMCMYQTKPDNNRRQIKSELTNPMMIDIKDLPKPSITKEDDNVTIWIHCTAPAKYSEIWFQLLGDQDTLNFDIREEQNNKVTFNITERSKKTYYCLYRIRVVDDFADSIHSDQLYIGEEGVAAYTISNIVRLLIAAVLLIAAGCFCFKHYFPLKTEERPPELPHARDKLVKGAKDNQLVCESGV